MRTEPRVRSILLPTGFRELSHVAAPMAYMLARAHGARIHVLHVIESGNAVVPSPVGLPDSGIILRTPGDVAQAESRLKQFVQCEIAPFHWCVTRALSYAAPIYQAICSYARQRQIDLIVMGTHAESFLHRAFHGSISKAVLEHTPCPVLLVPCARAREYLDVGHLLANGRAIA